MQFLPVLSYGLIFLEVYNAFVLLLVVIICKLWHHQISYVLYVQKLNENSPCSSSLLVCHMGRCGEPYM